MYIIIHLQLYIIIIQYNFLNVFKNYPIVKEVFRNFSYRVAEELLTHADSEC